jgi:hypothetical protein
MTRLVASFVVFALSSSAFAWSVPLYRATYNPGPHTAGTDIPCTYTNEDGQSFNGTVTQSASGGLFCTGLVAPTPDDVRAASVAADLLVEFGDKVSTAPVVTWTRSAKTGGIVITEAEPEGCVRVCVNGDCQELTAYASCYDYTQANGSQDGVTCDDLQ